MKKTIQSKPKKLSVAAPASNELAYEKDFYKWANDQVKLLKKREFAKLDLENLIEEIESLGRSEKRTLQSYLEVLLMHMLKAKYQPGMHTTSWDLSIKESSTKAKDALFENPSLKPQLKQILEKAYCSARLRAAIETKLAEKTFPEACPWGLKDIFPDLEKKYC